MHIGSLRGRALDVRVAKRATYAATANSSSHVLKGELVAAAFKPEDAI